MRAPVLIALILAAVSTVLSGRAEQTHTHLTGQEIADLLPGIYFDHASFWQEFEPDGVSHIVLRNNQHIPASWRIDGARLCLADTFRQIEERCYLVRADRPDGVLQGFYMTPPDGQEIYQRANER
ncbi:MAG: hypothetical protein AAGJ28_16070 [Pseudomonadota bacterium]